MLFKVGDTVTVRSDLVEGKQYYMKNSKECDTFMSEMEEWRGKKVVILAIDEDNRYCITNNADEGNWDIDWCWTDEMFEECFESK